MGSNRGKSPSSLTKWLLIARTAGRCQICNKFLLTDQFTMIDNDNSNMAHIVASSPDGPRGDEERSHKLSADIDNLMLLCRDHHNLIDNNADVYTEELLQKIKCTQEKRVRDLGESMNVEKTNIVVFQSPIKAKKHVSVNPQQIVQALIFNKEPVSLPGIPIIYEPHSDYRSKQYWEDADSFFTMSFAQVEAIHKFHPDTTFSVFPLGPIPLIIKLGYLFGDKYKTDAYQKFRSPDTWEWISNEKTNSFSFSEKKLSSGNNIAVLVPLSSEVAISRITEVTNANIIFELTADKKGVDCIQSQEDLSLFWHEYQSMFNVIKNKYPHVETVSMFPVVPVSAAFSIGSRYMQGVYPQIDIYDEDDGFFKTISIGGK